MAINDFLDEINKAMKPHYDEMDAGLFIIVNGNNSNVKFFGKSEAALAILWRGFMNEMFKNPAIGMFMLEVFEQYTAEKFPYAEGPMPRPSKFH